MEWLLPHRMKVYEALGCIGDGRIKISESGNEAEVISSSRGKTYSVKYDSEKNAIMANDNGSYWKGYLGYPSIAFLMLKGIIKYDLKYAEALKDIKWKDFNTQFKNDLPKSEEHIKSIVKERGISEDDLLTEIESIYSQLTRLKIHKLGNPIVPPKGY